MREEEQLDCVAGRVDHIVYRNEDGSFAVLEVDDGRDLITVVGSFGDVYEGEELEVRGHFVTHPTFGTQLKAVYFERRLPETAGAIKAYLGSGVIKGIGPKTAERIVALFGSDTLEVILKSPEQLTAVKGISTDKARMLGEEVKRMFGLRELIAFLEPYGIRAQTAVAAFSRYGAETLELIESNPFLLCAGGIDLPFLKADELRGRLGFDTADENRMIAGILYVLHYNASGGHTCLPKDKLLRAACQLLQIPPEQVEDCLDEMAEDGRLVKETVGEREFLFLADVWQSQQYLVDRLLLMRRNTRPVDKAAEKKVNALSRSGGIVYEQRQREAMLHALCDGVFILTGGPGTGKTTTVCGILELLEAQGDRVLLAAPTGRSAKRLSEVTGREAKTIHRLLEVDFSEQGRHRFIKNERNPLRADMIIVDEMSMVDSFLFESLLRAMPLHCRLLLVGDRNQLPSVGAGNVLGDLLGSGCFASVELDTIFRQAAESMIITEAHAIVSGRMPVLNRTDSDFFFLKSPSQDDTADTVTDLLGRRLPKAYGYSPLWDIQVLCPGKKGVIGTENLNRLLQQALNPGGPDKQEVTFNGTVFRQGDKVMQVKNNYDLVWRTDTEQGAGIYNGDIGQIESISRGTGNFRIRFDDKLCDYPIAMAYELDLAYAITVHKSQGCEFEAVVIPVGRQGGRLYYRNLLYTAVTRAKKLLVLVGRSEGVAEMVRNDRKTLRYTLLKTMLRRAYGTEAEE